LRCPQPASLVNEILLDHGILGGYDLGQDYPGMENYMLLAVTEMNTREEIDFLADILLEAGTDDGAGHHHHSEVSHAQ
jgi:glycine dehydrogenase subunit 1